MLRLLERLKTRSVALLRLLPSRSALLAAMGLMACQPQAADFVGVWVAPAERVSSMQWTSDSQTLLYSNYDGELRAVDLGSRNPRLLANNQGSAHLVNTSQGDALFFLRAAAGFPNEFECMHALLLGEELGTPRLVTTLRTFRDVLVSAHGETVALSVSNGVMTVDVDTGRSRLVPMDLPVAFAPNAVTLFGARDNTYVAIDASGVVTPIVEAARSPKAVTRWDADLPSQLVLGNSLLLDVATAETRPLLPGIETNARGFAGFSGDELRPAAAYVWQEECLRHTKVGQPPIEVCAEPRTTLHRVDLETYAERVIATMPEIHNFAVSPDGRKLAIYNDEVDTGAEPHIDLKELPPL